jgi:hypothetical protein
VNDAPRDSRRGIKLVLGIGFLAQAIALAVAHSRPATAYEFSVFTGTPVVVWLCLAVALGVFGFVAVTAADDWLVWPATFLGGLVVLTIVLLPLIRGYHFFGLADALTHLGWAREMATGELSVFETHYPGSHLFAGFVSAVFGLDMMPSILLTVGIFVAVFLVFVPLSVGVIVPNRTAVLVAAGSAFLLLPVNTISLYLRFHPFSLTTFFFPVAVYLLFFHLLRRGDTGRRSRLVATSVALPLVWAAIVLLHPQVAVDVMLLMGAIASLQFVVPRLFSDHTIGDHRVVYGQVAILVGIFALWNSQHAVLIDHGEAIVRAFEGLQTGRTEAGAVVQDRGTRAQSLGISLAELFVKVFLLGVTYTAVVGAYVLWKLGRHLADGQRNADIALYLTVGGLALVPLMLFSFVGDVSSFFFRHLGFSMLLITVLGSLAVYALHARFISAPDGRTRSSTDGGQVWSGGGFGSNTLSEPSTSRPVRIAAAVVIVLVVAFSLAAAFNSPYIYKANHHGTEYQFTGYQTAFDQAHDEVEFVGVRFSPDRFASAMPEHDPPLTLHSVPSEVPPEPMAAGTLSTYYEEDRYVTVAEGERRIATELYDGTFYSEQSFENLPSQPDVHHVQTNGGFDVYYVDTASEPAADDEDGGDGDADA